MSHSRILAQMAQAAQDAAALLPPRPGPSAVDTLPELAAIADAAEKPVTAMLRQRLEQARPGVGWAEEFDTDVAGEGEGEGEQWVVDPLDGGVQYLQGLPQWSVSITLIRGGRPILAALHSASLGHTYTASLGAGAFLDGAPIAPCAKTNLAVALVGTSHPPFVAAQPEAVAATARAVPVLLPAVGAHRNLGPTSWQVADVASGRMDAFWRTAATPATCWPPRSWPPKRVWSSPTWTASPGTPTQPDSWPPLPDCTDDFWNSSRRHALSTPAVLCVLVWSLVRSPVLSRVEALPVSGHRAATTVVTGTRHRVDRCVCRAGLGRQRGRGLSRLCPPPRDRSA